MIPFQLPAFHVNAFNCPYCLAFSNQTWCESEFAGWEDSRMYRSTCTHCDSSCFWYNKVMVVPDMNGFPPPNKDLNKEIIDDYLEAGAISLKSPRGAAALLRLSIQKLCIELGGKGKNINDDIAELVKKGLSPKVQKMLDIVRVIGNNAVHPGHIDLKDDTKTIAALARLLNEIANEMITRPHEIEELYSFLPEEARRGIEDRDKKD